jgi:4-hydroxybenzoate polyprenyltransferase
MKFRNLGAYLQERFAPVNIGLFVVLFCTVRGVATWASAPYQHLLMPAGGLAWAALGALATVSFFFRLRVFDEEKDFAQDALTHPQRVLQTGRVTLPQLRRLAWVGALLELGWSVAQGRATLLLWAVALGYSLLMRAEFGVGAWLRKRLVVYALSHMLIMPLVVLWLFSAYAPRLALGGEYLPLLLLLSLLGGFSFELARKLHAPAAERAGVDSYSRALGYGPALSLTVVVVLAGGAVQALLLHGLHARWGAYAVLWLLLASGLALYSTAARRPHEARLRQAEKVVSLVMLTSYLAVLAEAYGIGR